MEVSAEKESYMVESASNPIVDLGELMPIQIKD